MAQMMPVRLVGYPRVLYAGIVLLVTADDRLNRGNSDEVSLWLPFHLHSIQALFSSHALTHFYSSIIGMSNIFFTSNNIRIILCRKSLDINDINR